MKRARAAQRVFETFDRGGDWKPLNAGCRADFFPDPDPEFGHDPHTVRMHPANPDRLYMQNHCGIYRLDRPSDTWYRIGETMPKKRTVSNTRLTNMPSVVRIATSEARSRTPITIRSTLVRAAKSGLTRRKATPPNSSPIASVAAMPIRRYRAMASR